MPQTANQIRQLHVTNAHELEAILGEDIHTFLENLGQPTWITLEGEDRKRCRAVVTLLHANEPSGLKAIHEMLKRGIKPHTNLGIFIASVEAALEAPSFSHRYLPGEQDLNRCFKTTAQEEKLATNQHQLADQFIKLIRDFDPEAIIDTHNTSGHSEVFAVAAKNELAVRQATQIFTHKLVVINRGMGTLIEQDLPCPVVTVEFGGFLDPNADAAALESLETFITRANLFNMEAEALQVLETPLRLEVAHHCKLVYASTVDDEAELTMFNTIDQLNFRTLKANTAIGWIEEQHFNKIIALNQNQENVAPQLFKDEDGVLLTRVPMTVFMATTDAHIAMNDCLLYLCPEDN